MATSDTGFSSVTSFLPVTKWRGDSVPSPCTSRLATDLVITKTSSVQTELDFELRAL